MSSWIDYANKVLKDENEGQLIKLSATRFLNDLKRDDLEFNEQRVTRCLKFISLFKHYTGAHSGHKVQLQPWQQFIIANIVGFYWKGSNRRRFTSSYIEVARKNGKSFLASVLCLYFLIADNEDGAEVLLAANSKDQAKIAFQMCATLAGQLDSTNKVLKCYRSEILFKKTNSSLKCLASDDSKLDGFNASFGLIDEYHSAKNSKVRDVIKSSQGMRMSPHLCTITTAGFDKNLPCYELRQTNIEILKGLKKDDSVFIAIYSLDDKDDWRDENVWKKANPNLGITVYPEYLRTQVNTAINNMSEQVGVKTKNLNVWCESSNVWISDVEVLSSSKNVSWEDFKGQYIFVGVDLSATSDITAVSYMALMNGKYTFKTRYYLPRSATKEGKNSFYYKKWENEGILTVTEGNVTDYDAITKDLLDMSSIGIISNISYDSWNATQWALDCTAKGLPLNPYSQSVGQFNRPTKEFERLVKGNGVIIDNSSITHWCFKNVVIKSDANSNIKPIKTHINNKIDGVIAMLMALGGYLQQPHYSNQIYSL